MTDGELWSPGPNENWPTFWTDRAGRVYIERTSRLPSDAQQAVQGNAFVIRQGKVVEGKGMMAQRHPRTVVGIDAEGKTLTLLTVDGRRPGVSAGMTGAELGQEMKRLDCDTAINLDGGGSSELVLRDPETDEYRVINQPSGNTERAVANVIGVTVRRRSADR